MNGTIIWTMKTCLSHHRGKMEQNITSAGNHCPAVWDGLSCWGPTEPGRTASARCPSFKGSDITKSAFRVCGHGGEWLDRDGIPSPVGWTNYTPCLTPEIREIMRRLGSNDDAQIKFKIAANTRILEFVGLSLSLAALLLSLLIFYYFRTLKNSRTRLHRHLFIAMVIQVAIRLIVYADQAITRSKEFDIGSNITTPNPGRRGIDNTPILCEASYISLEYARTAMFMWMFVEGLFLHNMITVTVFEEKLSPLVYPIIGWIVPIPLTVAWAVVTYLHYGSATCWWGYNFTLYFWILEGPRWAVLMVNLAFLLNILRILVMKLRQSNSSEAQQALKAVKAALVLLPLLGLTNVLNMLNAPLEKSPIQFAFWSYTTHLLTSTQGFVLSLLYCFRNGEVQMAIRKFIRIRILGNSKRIMLARKPMPLSRTLDNASMSIPESGSGSGGPVSQAENINENLQTLTTFAAKRRDNIRHHHSTSSFLLQKEVPNTPPPLLHNTTRSYSNGGLKQVATEADSPCHQINYYSHQYQESKNPRNDSRRPLMFKNHDHDNGKLNGTMPPASLSVPVPPRRCSYNNDKGSTNRNPSDKNIPEQKSSSERKHQRSSISSRRIKITQMPWRFPPFPELLLKCSSRAGNQVDEGSSPSPSPKQKGSRIEDMIVENDGGKEYPLKERGSSQEAGQKEASPDLVCIEIEIYQDRRSSYRHRGDSDDDRPCRGCDGGCATSISFPPSHNDNELEYNEHDKEPYGNNDNNDEGRVKAG